MSDSHLLSPLPIFIQVTLVRVLLSIVPKLQGGRFLPAREQKLEQAQVERWENLTRWLRHGFSSTCLGVDEIASHKQPQGRTEKLGRVKGKEKR